MRSYSSRMILLPRKASKVVVNAKVRIEARKEKRVKVENDNDLYN